MLETLRKSTGSLVIKILLGLLILSFGVWGIGDMVRGGGNLPAAVTVGDVEIPAPVIRQEFQRQVERLRQFFGPDLTTDMARQMGVLDDTIQQIVSRATIDMATRDMGVVVSEDALRAAVLAEPAFHIGGQFSRDQFLRVLAANNLNEDRFVASLSDDLRRNRMVEAVAVNGAAPRLMAEALYRHTNEARVAETLTVDAQALPLTAEPTEDDLRVLYEDRREMFMTPQYRSFTVVHLATEDVMDRAAVDDTAIADHYEANRDQYMQPATRTVTQVIVDSADTAGTVAAAARQGAPLAQAAADAGAMEPIDMGTVELDGLPPGIAEAVFDLDAGQVSDPVQSPLGWHVFAVSAATPAQEQPLAEVRDEIRQRIASERAVDLLYEESSALQDALGGGATLEEATAQLGLRLYSVEASDIDGVSPTGQPVDVPDAFRRLAVGTAFQLEDGQESLLQEMDDGYFVVRVDSVAPAAPQPFADVADVVRAQWETARRTEQAAELATRLSEQAAAGADLAALAADEPALTHARHLPVTRAGATLEPADALQAVRPLDPNLMGPLFDLDTAGAATWQPGQGGAVVVRLTDIRPADPATDPEGVEALRAGLEGSVADDVLAQMTRAWGDRFGVTINQAVIREAF